MHRGMKCVCSCAAIAALSMVGGGGRAFGQAGAEATLATPTRAQLQWHDRELGAFIHLAPQTWQDSETDDLSTPLSDINPEKLDTDQWVRAAKAFGAKYLVFVAKHEGGFCWWQTETTEFCVRNTPWRGGKGDVLADLSRSCKEAGIGLGVYLSPQDRKHGVGVGGVAKDASAQHAYEQIFRQQLTEVLSRYGDMTEVWFDGSLVFDVGDILAKHAPHAVVFQGPQASIRWVGNEDGIAPYPAWNAVKFGDKKWGDYTGADGRPDGDRWLPIECDARIRSTWFWKTRNQDTLKTVSKLMEMYEQSVGHGAVLLLNHTPDRSGLVPEADVARAAEFGREIQRRYGNPICEGSGVGKTLTLKPAAPSDAGSLVIMEDISLGERVRKYRVEGRVGSQWRLLAQGSAVGHKRIQPFTPAKLEEVRLTIEESVGEPHIRKLALFAPYEGQVVAPFDHP